MNYNIKWTADAILEFIISRNPQDGTDISFYEIKNYVLSLKNIDQTPEWAIIAALGSLEERGKISMKVYKRDQADISHVKIRLIG